MRAAWYVILWRLLWIVPAYVARFVFVLIILVMHGFSTAEQAWEVTR